jgi:hypothetical protein
MFKMNFLKMRTESALKKNKSPRASTPYHKAQNIGILFSVEDKEKHHQIKEFIHRLEQEGKKVQVLEYLPLKKDNYEFLFDFFTIEELNFWGSLTSEKALRFVDIPFDYLFCIDKESNPLILNLLARSKSRCRVGYYNELESQYFEFMIQQNGTIKNLIEAMHKYTKQLS